MGNVYYIKISRREMNTKIFVLKSWIQKCENRNQTICGSRLIFTIYIIYLNMLWKKMKNPPLKWFRHWVRPELKLASQWWWLHWFYVSSLLGMGKRTRYYSLPLQLLPFSLSFFPFILFSLFFCQVQPHLFFLFPCFSSPFSSHFLSEDLPVLFSYFLFPSFIYFPLPFFAFIFFNVLISLLSFLFLFLFLGLSFSIFSIPYTFPLSSS